MIKHWLRPIILRTRTTIGGRLLLWYGGGPKFELMAIIFGFPPAYGTHPRLQGF